MTKIKQKIVVIVGPTASGKTALAIKLAKRFNGEVISADSRQVYRGMDIGTNKPTSAKASAGRGLTPCYPVKGIPHYLIDIVNPDEEFTLGHWLELAKKTITEIKQRNHIPIITGGTGLYISALIYGFDVPTVPPNLKLRKKLEEEISKYGTEHLAKKILKRDPNAASFLDTKNPRRLIRAWEIIEATGEKFSAIRKKSPESKYEALIIGLNPQQDILYRKIKSRLKAQFKRGLKKEINKLSKKYGWNLPSMSTLGYSQWKAYANKPINKKMEWIIFNAIANDTIRYSKRQMTWFKKIPEIKWLNVSNKKPRAGANSIPNRRLEQQATQYILRFLRT